MGISESDVRHVAALARVELDPEKLPLLVIELNGILQHMDVLQRVDVPSDRADELSRAMVLADDAVGGIALERPREEMAPAMRDGFFLVPRLSTHSAPSAQPARLAPEKP